MTGQPDLSWTAKQLTDYAAQHNIDIGRARAKPNILAAIEKAQAPAADNVPPVPSPAPQPPASDDSDTGTPNAPKLPPAAAARAKPAPAPQPSATGKYICVLEVRENDGKKYPAGSEYKGEGLTNPDRLAHLLRRKAIRAAMV